jgi:hypothetical protein
MPWSGPPCWWCRSAAPGVGDPGGRPARVAARVLGTRHLVQAAALAGSGGPAATRAGAAVDGLHAASMVALGLAMPGHRRAALASGAVAAWLAALELTAVAGG